MEDLTIEANSNPSSPTHSDPPPLKNSDLPHPNDSDPPPPKNSDPPPPKDTNPPKNSDPPPPPKKKRYRGRRGGPTVSQKLALKILDVLDKVIKVICNLLL